MAFLASRRSFGLEALSKSLPRWQAEGEWTERAKRRPTPGAPPWTRSRSAANSPLVNCPTMERSSVRAALEPAIHFHRHRGLAAGTLPAELHKLWRTSTPGGYHMEYGYSTMGYEIAGGLGVKMARPDREVIVMVGDGSYLMLNNEIATP